MKRLLFISIVLLVLMCYEAFWHDKRTYASIPESNYIAFAEKVDHAEKIGICDDDYVVLREAKYFDVEGYDGYVVAHYYDDNLVDIFTADGDSILPEILKSGCYYYTADTIGYFIINDIRDNDYLMLSKTGEIVGPYPKMSLVPSQKLILSRDSDYVRLFMYDGREISPSECTEAIFVEETHKQKRRKSVSSIVSRYVLMCCDSLWVKVTTDGNVCDTIENDAVDCLKQNESFKTLEMSQLSEVKVSI